MVLEILLNIKFGTGRVTDIIMGGKDYEVTVDFADLAPEN